MSYYEELARIKADFVKNSQKTLEELTKCRKGCEECNAFFTKKDTQKMIDNVVNAIVKSL